MAGNTECVTEPHTATNDTPISYATACIHDNDSHREWTNSWGPFRRHVEPVVTVIAMVLNQQFTALGLLFIAARVWRPKVSQPR